MLGLSVQLEQMENKYFSLISDLQVHFGGHVSPGIEFILRAGVEMSNYRLLKWTVRLEQTDNN